MLCEANSLLVLWQSPMSAEFLADLTLPDGTPQPANATLRKVWRVKNNGTSFRVHHTISIG